MSSQVSADSKNRLLLLAEKHGFAAAGIALPETPSNYRVYEEWLENGHHAGMGYLASAYHREARKDFEVLLPNCQSILVLLLRYPNPSDLSEAESDHGRVAAYAMGHDYHDVFMEKAENLMEEFQQEVGLPVEYSVFVDSGPILEHDLAVKAGLGWVGKNSLLINQEMGSCFFIGEILLNLDLEPDGAYKADHCGICTRCIDACPTGCILENRTIDARRCISYLTIENKQDIPGEVREQIGDWIFGCDICQMVCPWNQRLKPFEVDQALLPKQQYVFSIPELLSISKQAFNKKFKGSPISRAKQRGMARNASIVIGNRTNAGDEDLIQDLKYASSNHEEIQVRDHAGWALKKLAGK